jgi:hypothetical protein
MKYYEIHVIKNLAPKITASFIFNSFFLFWITIRLKLCSCVSIPAWVYFRTCILSLVLLN